MAKKRIEDMSEELKKYIVIAEKLAIAKSDLVFKNSSHDHAAVVLTLMMKYSKEEFCIYDNDLSGDIADQYEGFYEELDKHILNNKKINIVIDNHNQEKTEIYLKLNTLKASYPDLVNVRRSDDNFKSAVKSIFNIPLNFSFSDTNAYRIEEISEGIDVDNRKAFCCFNKPEVSNRLKSIFDNHFKNLKPVF